MYLRLINTDFDKAGNINAYCMIKGPVQVLNTGPPLPFTSVATAVAQAMRQLWRLQYFDQQSVSFGATISTDRAAAALLIWSCRSFKK